MLRRITRVSCLTLALACSDVVNPNCTDRGCIEGLFLRLDGDLPAEFTVRLITVSTAPWEVSCTPADCDGLLTFEGFLPRRVTVEIETDGAVVYEEHFEPVYEGFFPNGPDCDGFCLQSMLEITV